jgi:hypothetical protein
MAAHSLQGTWDLYTCRRRQYHHQEQFRLHINGDVQALLKSFFHPEGEPDWLDPPPELSDIELNSFLQLARRDLRKLPSKLPGKNVENVILLDDRSHDFEFTPSGKLENDTYRGNVGHHKALSLQAFHDHTISQKVSVLDRSDLPLHLRLTVCVTSSGLTFSETRTWCSRR